MGRVVRAHGIRGEVALVTATDFPDRFVAGARFLTDEPVPRPVEIEALRRHGGTLLAKLRGIDDRDAAEELRGVSLTIAADERRPLGADEFWPDQLEGLAVLLPDGTRLGVVTGVVLGEAQDRLVVRAVGGAITEIPFVEGIVGEVHPSGGFVVVDPPEGLL